MSTTNYNKPTQADWRNRYPGLKKVGSELKGKCPNCGGDDRFHVRSDGLFGCRKDCSYTDILKAAGLWQEPNKSQSNGKVKPDTWRYHGTKGSYFDVCRLDGLSVKQVWQEPKDVELQNGELWLPYVKNDNRQYPILIVEGERTCDIAASCLDGFTVLTWQRSIARIDWSLCKGRDVLIWPDNDIPGFRKAAAVVEQVDKHDPKSIKIVHAGGRWKDDAADFVKRNQNLTQIIKSNTWDLGGEREALKPIVAISDRGLVRALRFLGIKEFRYNLRSQKTEFMLSERAIFLNGTSKKGNLKDKELAVGVWHEINDRSENAIREEIRRRLNTVRFYERNGQQVKKLATAVFGKDRWTECLNAALARREIDPFKEWLQELTPKQSDLLDTWLNDLFHINLASQDFVNWGSRFFFLGAVWRTMQPGCKLDEIPVLSGAQGVGKSAVGRSILPTDFVERGHGDALVLADDPKKVAESLQGRIVVEASEMSGISRADVERLKANISRQDDGSVRLSYRKNPETLPRRAIFYGTSNDDQFLPNDPTGNRRFVSIVIEREEAKQRVEDYFRKHREELWAAAMYEYSMREPANFPRDLFAAQKDANQEHRINDPVIEDDVAAFNWNQFAMEGGTLSKITKAMYADTFKAERMIESRGWSHRLGRALKAQSWTKLKTKLDGKRVNLWYPPNRTP